MKSSMKIYYDSLCKQACIGFDPLGSWYHENRIAYFQEDFYGVKLIQGDIHGLDLFPVSLIDKAELNR